MVDRLNLRRFTTAFSINPGEEQLIGGLALLYFVLSLGFVLVQSMAFGVFLAEYGVGGLSYSYITIAIIASAVVAFYIRLGERIPFLKLLLINLAFLTSATLLLWLGLNTPVSRLIAFLLPLWFQTSINLGTLAVWSLAGRLFDFRQGKRLFPLLSASSWLADIVGGLFVLALVNLIGAVHLLFWAGVSFGIALLLLRFLLHGSISSPIEKPATRRPSRSDYGTTSPFENRYILLIFAYTLIWWVAFFFLDNIFYDRAYTQYPSVDQLTAFLGRLLMLTGVVALISSLAVTGRLLARFGLRIALLAMPVTVTASAVLLAASGTLGASLVFVFVLISLAKVMNVALGFSLSQAAHAIVYQSLPDRLRNRVQTTAEGIVQPLAVGLAGISLLVLTTGLKLGYLGLTYVFLALGGAWLLIILLLSRNYVRALTQVITRRRLGDDVNVLPDPIHVELLRSRLHDPHPGVAIYALTRLEMLNEQSVRAELAVLIRHPAPEVRCEAFRRVEVLRLETAGKAVQEQYLAESAPPVREAALRALGAVSKDKSQLFQALEDSEVHALRGGLIGLLKYSDDSRAEAKIRSLLAASSIASRKLAIEVIAEAGQREFYPQLVAACDDPESDHAAGRALASLGEDTLPAIELAFCAPQAPRRRLTALARALGQIGGERSQAILQSRLTTPDSELRLEILRALSRSEYRAKEDSVIRHALRNEILQAARMSALLMDLDEMRENETQPLAAALRQFHEHIRARVLLLLSFVFDRRSVLRVQESLTTGSQAELPYALEIMDAQLPSEWKREIMPLLEDLSARERYAHLALLFPQPKEELQERLHQMSIDENIPYWLRACAVHCSTRLGIPIREGDEAMLSNVEKVLVLKTVPIFSQTPDHILADVANLLEEADVSENETIFKQGDAGDSLYIILDGRVKVHDNEQVLNYLGERDIFGEMALLDPEPRLASVTAVEPTHLLRLDQSSFYQLMAERPEVASGIIRVLTRHLRNRVHDIAELKARLQVLESRSTD